MNISNLFEELSTVEGWKSRVWERSFSSDMVYEEDVVEEALS